MSRREEVVDCKGLAFALVFGDTPVLLTPDGAGGLKFSGLLTDYGAGPLKLGTDGVPVAAGSGDIYTAGLIEINGMPIRTDDPTNVYIGQGAGVANVSGLRNTLIGYLAGNAITSGSSNFFHGSQAGLRCTEGVGNVGIGVNTLAFLTTQSNNMAIGTSSLYNTINEGNTAIGDNVLSANTTGAYNVGIGYRAGQDAATGHYNILIGMYAGRGVAGQRYDNNILIGRRAGYVLTTGSNNMLLGYRAGDNLTSGANNIILGYDLDASSPTVDNELNIGDILKGDLSSKALYLQGLLTDDGTGPLKLGTDGVPAYAGSGDVYVGGVLESEGQVNAKAGIWCLGDFKIWNNKPLGLDQNYRNQFYSDPAFQTNWTSFLYLDENFNDFAIASRLHRFKDYGLPVHLDPTLALFSRSDPTTNPDECLKLSHQVTKGVVESVTGDLAFKDPNVGEVTLTELKSMRNVWIKALSQSPGNLTLNDATNWATQYSFISGIKVKTASTDWDLWLCEDNTFTTTALETRRLATNRNGDFDITVMREYNSDGNNVYLRFIDNSGSNTADFYITGEARRH